MEKKKAGKKQKHVLISNRPIVIDVILNNEVKGRKFAKSKSVVTCSRFKSFFS